MIRSEGFSSRSAAHCTIVVSGPDHEWKVRIGDEKSPSLALEPYPSLDNELRCSYNS